MAIILNNCFSVFLCDHLSHLKNPNAYLIYFENVWGKCNNFPMGAQRNFNGRKEIFRGTISNWWHGNYNYYNEGAEKKQKTAKSFRVLIYFKFCKSPWQFQSNSLWNMEMLCTFSKLCPKITNAILPPLNSGVYSGRLFLFDCSYSKDSNMRI